MLIGRSPIFSPKSWNVRIDVPCAGKSSKPANYARPHFAHHLLVDPLPYQIHVNPNESNMRYWMWEVKKHLNNPQEVKLHMEVGFCHNAKTTPSLHPKKQLPGFRGAVGWVYKKQQAIGQFAWSWFESSDNNLICCDFACNGHDLSRTSCRNWSAFCYHWSVCLRWNCECWTGIWNLCQQGALLYFVTTIYKWLKLQRAVSKSSTKHHDPLLN